MKNKLIVISGPSGSGKSTISRALLNEFPRLEFSVSSTTREIRINESHCKDYYFLTKDAFNKQILNNEFLEYEEVYEGIYYGTSKSEIQRILNLKKVPLLDVDVKGALSVKSIFKDEAFLVFIHPGTINLLKERLIFRNTDSLKVIENRLKKAEFELSFARQFDRVIFNTADLHSCISNAISIVKEFLNLQ